MKRILITGDEGFIGSHLIPLLYEQNQLDLWDNRYRNVVGDIFQSTFGEAVKNSDIVIHLAALTSVERSFKNPGEVFRTNVLGTARVVEFCMRYNKKLIFPSSAAIYHRELSPYAESKALAEDIVREAQKSIPVVILRLYNVFGEGMNPNSGSVMYHFLNDKKLVIYGDGEQTRDYIHVNDVVSVMKEAIKPNWNGQIVDVGTGEAYTANYVAGLFAHYRKKKLFYEPPRREIKWSIANTKVLKSLYKKPLQTNLQEDIKALCLTGK